MRTIATALAASILLAGSAYAKLISVSETGRAPIEIQSRDVVAETERYCLTLAIYFEGGSTFEPEIGQRHIARVITERAKADRRYWGGNTICGVVFYKSKGVCQFSFACLPMARRTPKKNLLWHASEAVAVDAIEGRNDDPDASIRYYMNEELSALKNVCAFRKEFVPVAKAGRHEFFREATADERATLAKTNPEACQRYAELLKKAKAKKKKQAKKALAAKRGKAKVASR
ncbi:MAG: cell wall hydrolase [Xanthobacteraceae bacterium]|nr:cell wall hydrolase [Xanthobacteraceae bacterium]